MGYPLPMEEELLDMLAFMSLDAGQPAKARAVLSVSAEYYPGSAAVHESLVDVCLAMEDYACAETHARLADQISGGDETMMKVMKARDARE
jgi:hypothetical protein